VARAAAGLASYLLAHGHRGAPVVVGYDARYNSDVFATDTVAVLAGAGLRPLLLPRPLPTPVLAFAIRRLNCAAGVMVTASHNPRQDNGYKVYLGDGSQIVPPVDAEIAAAMSEVSSVARIPRGDSWTVVGEDVVHDYLDRVASLPATDPQAFRDLRIVYTPLHGVGGPLVEEALRRAGFAPPAVVPEQAAPDPGFPTTPFPNPEEPGTLDLALELGRRTDADVVLANDPDADRLAVAVPTEEGFRRLTGDEVGALLAVHLLNAGARGTLATTVVSSTLLSSIATAHGVPYTQTLTGFKWLGRVPDLAFAYEEALGYCVDPEAVRDKDGISALIRMAELVAALKREGRTLLDLLDDIAREHDLHATAQHAVWVRDLSEIDAVLERLRQRPPLALGGREVLRTDDLAEPTDGLPPTVGLRFVLAGRHRRRRARARRRVTSHRSCAATIASATITAMKTNSGHRQCRWTSVTCLESSACFSASMVSRVTTYCEGPRSAGVVGRFTSSAALVGIRWVAASTEARCARRSARRSLPLTAIAEER